MGLDKYKFVPGEKYPAENASSIDPDNVIPQAAGYLIGGNNPSTLTIFKALGINYDTVHDTITTSDDIVSNVWCGQSFNSGVTGFLEKIAISIRKYGPTGGTTYLSIYAADGSSKPTGAAIATVSVSRDTLPWDAEFFDFVFNLQLTPLTTYVMVLHSTYAVKWGSNSDNEGLVATASSDGGSNWGTQTPLCRSHKTYFSGGSNDGKFKADIDGVVYDNIAPNLSAITSMDDVAAAVQAAIRTATSKTETVVWSTDHFIITSTTKNRKSQVLKLMTPSSGTDISGLGATPYLDMADNATEIQGTGEDYRLVRLNSNGELDGSNLINLKNANTNFVVLPSTIIRTTGGSKYITSSTVIKVKEIEYKNISGRIKILWGATGNNSNNASAQIYKNGVAVGINRTTLGNSAYTYEEDFDVNSGDLIQIYGSGSSGLTINYFNLCYLKTLKTESDVINL